MGQALWVWHHGVSVHGVLNPTASFAEKVETDDEVILRTEPHGGPGALDQRVVEERKEAASWEMLRRLTIEVERPWPMPGFSPALPSQTDQHPSRPQR
ncbi:hypothetical protein [Desulfosoma caldarium]|uniref:Uncharacterized protein n=1 Tax=Desulfosoma caldarium TaxID=610254 RepID=A0A3N1VPU7_9BACT|nr:hypothetical protein [Desulfosoma caldarium]ROR01917.1 hypothetical protein EDC27_1111 [Desulfosoma caldarium]